MQILGCVSVGFPYIGSCLGCQFFVAKCWARRSGQPIGQWPWPRPGFTVHSPEIKHINTRSHFGAISQCLRLFFYAIRKLRRSSSPLRLRTIVAFLVLVVAVAGELILLATTFRGLIDFLSEIHQDPLCLRTIAGRGPHYHPPARAPQ